MGLVAGEVIYNTIMFMCMEVLETEVSLQNTG